jgi:hypothetical protein
VQPRYIRRVRGPEPCNGADTHRQQPASQPDDNGKEYCYVPEGKKEQERFYEDRHSLSSTITGLMGKARMLVRMNDLRFTHE